MLRGPLDRRGAVWGGVGGGRCGVLPGGCDRRRAEARGESEERKVKSGGLRRTQVGAPPFRADWLGLRQFGGEGETVDAGGGVVEDVAFFVVAHAPGELLELVPEDAVRA